MEKKKLKMGRPHSLKNPVTLSLSLSESEKKEFERQMKLSGSSSLSHYLRVLIKEKQEVK